MHSIQREVKQLIYVEIMSSDLKDYWVYVMVSLATYQGCCEMLLAVDGGIWVLMMSLMWMDLCILDRTSHF